MVSRIKIISRLDIAERRLPQDGSFALATSTARRFDFRVSTLPTVYGEKVVLRLLEKAAVVERYSVENLGFEKEQLEVFLKGIRRPWGMVLVTGPTGSGKSTTLHTAIKFIKSPRKNVVTVEDPVEYRQPGIQQVHIKSEIGFDFSRALRSILRQDPDIIMIGEIRDEETAQIAVKAALTGHLVLIDAAHERRGLDPRPPRQHRGRALPAWPRPSTWPRPSGWCAGSARSARSPTGPPRTSWRSSPRTPGRRCSTAGGAARIAATWATPDRMALYEVFGVDAEVRRMLIDGADGDKIQRYAIESGMITLKQCGFRQAARGLTTLEEVLAVAADSE